MKYRGKRLFATFKEEASDNQIKANSELLKETVIIDEQPVTELVPKVIKEGYGVFDRANFFKALKTNMAFR